MRGSRVALVLASLILVAAAYFGYLSWFVESIDKKPSASKAVDFGSSTRQAGPQDSVKIHESLENRAANERSVTADSSAGSSRAPSAPVPHPLLLSDSARKYAITHIRGGDIQDRIYARRIMQECAASRSFMSIHEIGSPPSTGDSKISKVYNDTLDFFQRRCGQFTDAELEELLAIRFESESPLISRYNGSGKILPSSREGLISELIRSKNPVLFQEFTLAVLLDKDNMGRFIYFRGAVHRLSDPIVDQALYFLPCLLGLNCSSNSYRYGLSCLNVQQCEVPDYRSNPLANQMYADIMSGNIESFIQKRQ